jgi:hypothetical protein
MTKADRAALVELRALAAEATPGPWAVCQHLKSIEDDAACPCGYRGVIWGPEHDIAMAICQPGHDRPWREEEWGSEPGRYPREVEIANSQLIAAAPTMLTLLESQAATIAELEDELAGLRNAATDAYYGWRYIRANHGDLYGVGWDRVENKLEAVLTKSRSAG